MGSPEVRNVASVRGTTHRVYAGTGLTVCGRHVSPAPIQTAGTRCLNCQYDNPGIWDLEDAEARPGSRDDVLSPDS